MLSINLHGSDWALRIVVTWICRKIYSMLFIFSTANLFFQYIINLITRQRFPLAYAKCAKFIHEYFLVVTYTYMRVQIRDVHRHYQRFTRRTIRTDDARGKKEKRKEEGGTEQQRGRSMEEEKEVEVGHRLPRRDATNTHACIRPPYVRGDSPSGSPR